jgi:hypothetical protein
MNTDTSTNNGLTRTLSDITSPNFGSKTLESESSNWFYFSWKTWLIIILLLAFLGINIFAYLGKGINDLTTFLKPILALIGYKTLETTEQTADVAATGAKAGAKVAAVGTATGLDLTASGLDLAAKGATIGLDLAAKGAKAGINFVAGGTSDIIKGTADIITGKPASSSLSTQTSVEQEERGQVVEDDNVQRLQSALNNASKSSTVVPDSAQSSIQSTGKSGWCFIGEDKGIRHCSPVGVNDRCMSGQIFDTSSQCVKQQ